jgi:hypothetical protein
MRAVVRIAYLIVYASLAAIGEGLVARPAMLWAQGQGILRPALPWQVPFGAAALGLAALVALVTLWLASAVALGRRPRVPQHAAFLALLAACLALRAGPPEPLPPRDPSPSLLAGLRAAADELDRDFSGAYAPDAGRINGALAQIAPPGFRRLGRSIPLHARILSGAEGPQLEPLPGDEPGTIYASVSREGKTAWLTALSAGGLLRTSSGKPAIVEAHAGTHSLPGRDPLVPAYPGMRNATR